MIKGTIWLRLILEDFKTKVFIGRLLFYSRFHFAVYIPPIVCDNICLTSSWMYFHQTIPIKKIHQTSGWFHIKRIN